MEPLLGMGRAFMPCQQIPAAMGLGQWMLPIQRYSELGRFPDMCVTMQPMLASASLGTVGSDELAGCLCHLPLSSRDSFA